MTNPAAVPAIPTVPEDLKRLADYEQEQLRDITLPRPLRRSADSLLAQVRRSRSYREARTAAHESATEIAKLAEFVALVSAEVASREQARSVVEPFGRAWKDMVATEIGGAGDGAPAAWVCRYAEAFVAGKFAICVWLCSDVQIPGEPDLSRRMLLAARAARERNLAASLPALETLTESDYAESLPSESLFRAWCMRARAVARGLGDAARARDLARAAVSKADSCHPALPADVTAALHTALGECLLDSNDIDGALAEMERAVRGAPQEPAGCVLRGLIAEAAQDYARADEWYEDAADIGGERAISGELYAPVPPNLLWKYGRRVRKASPAIAAQAIRKALQSGVRGSGQYPERKVYVDLARALKRGQELTQDRARLEQLGAEAAQAYWEAGRRFAWVGDEDSALSYLAEACNLDPARPLYAFEQAEVLRMRAVHADGTVDLDRLQTAADGWRQAYALQVPGRDIPWAYTTMALIAHEESGDLYRPRASWPAAALLERGLLCDPGNIRTIGQLSQAHRLLGNRRTALGLTEAAHGQDGDEKLVFDQHLLALLETGQFGRGLELIDKHGLRADQPWLIIRKVQYLIAQDRPDDALAVLESSRPTDEALHDLYLGLCHELMGDEQAARQAYERIYTGADQTGPPGRQDLFARASYLAGRYQEAENIYTQLIEQDPTDASLRCDFGELLLTRGDETQADITKGRDLLLAGIADTESSWALWCLERIELPRLLRHVGGQPHEEEVLQVTAEAQTALSSRRQMLDQTRSPAAEIEARAGANGEPAVRSGMLLALARMDLADGKAEAALERYVAVAAEVPEATYGIEAAGDLVRRRADQLTMRGELAEALATGQRLVSLLGRAPNSPSDVAAAAQLQAALTALELGQIEEFEVHAVQAFASDRSATAARLTATLDGVFERPGQYWELVDAARRMMERADETGPPGTADMTAAAGRMLTALEPSALLHSRRHDIDAANVFLLATPLAIRLGGGLLGQDQQARVALRRLVERVRRSVEEDTGVPIPGIGLQSLSSGADPGAYMIEVFETGHASGVVPPAGVFVLNGGGDPDREHPEPGHGAPSASQEASPRVEPLTGKPGRWLEAPAASSLEPGQGWTAGQFVVRHLEAVIRTHLPRLFAIDDVGIWLSSVSASSAVGADVDRLSRADRLEILRLLRLLLREQVPIADAGTIFRVVHAAEPEWSALDLLPAVRAALKSRLTPAGVRALPPAWLPAELETALAAGFAEAGPAEWRLPRAEAATLMQRLLDWHRSHGGSGAIVVRDARLRPFCWRLLAGLIPGPVWVLAKEEIDDPD
jgi:tetratricopeptide (TPR) repeat protein